ncbi:DUF3267 domain-containing protein [Haloglomus litoreum]|uniref:DUF3267 domain-containing protein n=1 Tax=Haloglomus litoreum TaxID=3034026 RepID=UPI0023E76A5D|nr:DUF3267 domain-containing protein [Haloglomus sp. DT116]
MSTADAAGSETLLADLELSRGLTIQMTAVGGLGFVVSFAVFTAVFQAATGRAASFAFAPGVGWWNDALNLLVIAVLATVILVPHEWLHGLAFRHYGGDPSYGVGVAHFILPYAYATSPERFTRNQFLVILLAPLVVMTAVGVPAMLLLGWGWLALPLAANAGGAVADVWMALTLLGYPAHVGVEDHEKGVRILGRAGDRVPALSVTNLSWDALAGAAVAAFGLLLLLGIGGPLFLSALGVDSLTVGRPGTITYLFSFVNTPDEISLGIGPGILVLGSLLGLCYAFARSYRRRRGPAAGE